MDPATVQSLLGHSKITRRSATCVPGYRLRIELLETINAQTSQEFDRARGGDGEAAAA